MGSIKLISCAVCDRKNLRPGQACPDCGTMQAAEPGDTQQPEDWNESRKATYDWLLKFRNEMMPIYRTFGFSLPEAIAHFERQTMQREIDLHSQMLAEIRDLLLEVDGD